MSFGKYVFGFGINSSPRVSQGYSEGSGGSRYNMEGPPIRSSSVPKANMDSDCEYEERKELGDFEDYLEDKSSVNDAARRIVHVDAERKAMEALCFDEVAGDKDIYDIFPSVATAVVDEYLGSVTDREDIFIGLFTDKSRDDDLSESEKEEDTQQEEHPGNNDGTIAAPEGNRVSATVSVRSQAQNLVHDAADGYHRLKAAVDAANEMLQTMRKPAERISDDLMSEIEVFLTDTPGWYLSVLNGKDKTIEILHREIYDIREQCNKIILDREQLRIKLEESGTSGLSSGDKMKLRSLGIESLSDLINKYRLLQIQVGDSAERSITQAANLSERSNLIKADRVDSTSSLDSIIGIKKECQDHHRQKNQKLPAVPPKVLEQGWFPSFDNSNVGKSGGGTKAHIPIPMPEKFKGKTRIDLDRYLLYFDRAVTSREYSDEDKTLMLGNYIPSLQFVHDKLIRKKASYDEMKEGLLNAMGTNSCSSTFALRTSLDRLKKSGDKLYKNLLEDVEHLVTQAFNNDDDQGDAELKKILIRLTQEDSNPIFGSTIIPHVDQSYARLKELVLAVEAGLEIKRKNDLQLKDQKSSTSDPHRPYLSDSKRYNSGKQFKSEDTRSYGRNPYEPEEIVVESNRTESGRYPSAPAPLRSSPVKDNVGYKPPVCYKCKKEGHWASFCTDTQGIRQIKPVDALELNGLVNIDNVEQPGSDSIHMFGKKAVHEVYLDSVKINALLDTGACASVISEAAIGKILRQRPKDVRKITEEDPKTFMHKRLVGADGRALKVVNCLRIPIAWGNRPPKFAKFFIVTGLKQDVIIGTNILQDDGWIEALTSALGRKSIEANQVAVSKHGQISSRETMVVKEVESRRLKTKIAKKKFESNVVNKIQETQMTVMDTVTKTNIGYGKPIKKVFREIEKKSCKNDTVVIGGINANNFACAIGATHWNSTVLMEDTFYSKFAVNGITVKRVIYLPCGDIFFRRGLDFDNALKLYMYGCQQLSKLDTVEVIILPLFRNCSCLNVSNKITAWYSQRAQRDARFIGKQQVVGKNIFQWMNSTNSVQSPRRYVNALGIITADGINHLCEYMDSLDYGMKVHHSIKLIKSVNADRDNQLLPTKHVRDHSNQSKRDNLYAGRTWYNSNMVSDYPKAEIQRVTPTSINNSKDRGCDEARGRKFSRGRDSVTVYQSQGGLKRKVNSWMDESKLNQSIRRRRDHQ